MLEGRKRDRSFLELGMEYVAKSVENIWQFKKN
jgi:hypothetical protein